MSPASLSTGASNTYSGNTYIMQGELQIRNNHALGFGKAVVSNGADLAFGGGVNYGTLTNNIDLNGGDGNGSAGALQVNDANTIADLRWHDQSAGQQQRWLASPAPITFTISGPIIGPGGLRKQNHIACTVILTSPANSYSGGTLVVGGTLQLGNGGSCGSLGSGPVTNNGTLAYNHSDSIANNSVISGTGNLTHTGTGTLTLGGANTYAGTTAVNGGTLVVNGALAPMRSRWPTARRWAATARLAAVSIQSGGTLALGASIGTLTVNNVLNLGGTTVMKINRTGGTLSSDLIQGVSILSYDGVLKVTATGDPLAAGDSFKLFNATTYASNFSSTNLPALARRLVLGHLRPDKQRHDPSHHHRPGV